MIDWSSVEINPPPILQNMTNAELSIRVAKKTLAIPDFPCHSQSVERLIKEVIRASAIVSNKKFRHGLIISSAKSKKSFQNWSVSKILYNVFETMFFQCLYFNLSYHCFNVLCYCFRYLLLLCCTKLEYLVSCCCCNVCTKIIS